MNANQFWWAWPLKLIGFDHQISIHGVKKWNRLKNFMQVMARVDDIERVSNCTIIAAAIAQIVSKSAIIVQLDTLSISSTLGSG